MLEDNGKELCSLTRALLQPNMIRTAHIAVCFNRSFRHVKHLLTVEETKNAHTKKFCLVLKCVTLYHHSLTTYLI